MRRPLAWVAAVVVGAAAILFASWGLLELIAFVGLTVAAARVGAGAAWLAGFLTGIGGTWELFALRWVLSGWPGDAIPDEAAFVGLVPLALGLAWSVVIAARASRPARSG